MDDTGTRIAAEPDSAGMAASPAGHTAETRDARSAAVSPARSRAGVRLGAAAGLLRTAARVRLAEPEVRGLREIVARGDVCFDIGSAYGMYGFPLADLVGPTGAVLSFEPQPRPRALLGAVRRAVAARQIRLSHAGIGHVAGRVPLVRPARFGVRISGHAHLAHGLAVPHADAARLPQVPVTTVDAVCAEHAIERVAFIKADVEGFEPAVLRGAASVLERDRPALLLEIEDRHLGRYGTSAAEVSDHLRGLGYAMSTWRGDRWLPAERVELGTRNYLFRAARGVS